MPSFLRCASCFLAVLAVPLAMAQTITKVSLSPTAVAGGAGATGTVTLSKKAGANGAVISLTSSSKSATVASSVTVPSGSTSATFSVSTTPVAATTTATVKAKLGTTSKTASLTVDPPALTALALGASAASGASIVSGTVTLGSAAPTAGISVSLSSSSSSASVPSTVKVSAGDTSASFSITTKAVKASTTAKITAKFGTKSDSESLTLEPVPTLAGTYAGSFFSSSIGASSFSLGPVNVTISSAGTISGSANSYGPDDTGEAVSLSGTAESDGGLSITATQSGQSNTQTGVWVFNSAGDLVVLLQNAGSASYTSVTLTASSHVQPFAGSYTGTLVDEYGYGPYISTFSISSGGSFTGTAVPLSDSTIGSYSGTLNSSGEGNLKFTSSASGGTSYSGPVYTAFTPAGLLVGYLVTPGGPYTIALAKSYAGLQTITFGTGANAPTAEIAVSDTGIVTGGGVLSNTPFLLTGTVSSTGTVDITATSIGGATPESFKLTGTMVAVLGAVSGRGTVTGSETGTWTSTGKDSSGLVYSGSYTLTAGTATLKFTIDEGGTISGAGSGAAAGTIVTGAVLADGSILVIAIPTSALDILEAASLVGTLSLKTVSEVTGSGNYISLGGSAGTWTATGTRG